MAVGDGAAVGEEPEGEDAVKTRAGRLVRLAKTGVRTGKMLWLVRAALPRWARVMLAITIGVKMVTAPLPFDGGVDEVLLAVTAGLLWWRQRPLLRACWRAAVMEA